MQMPLSRIPVALTVAALGLAGAAALVLSSASGAGARPVGHLALVRSDPVTVSGRGFRARVRVQLRVVAHTTVTRRVLAGRNGRFTATFPTVIDRCSGWSVTATQPGRAPTMLRSPPRPECAPLSTQ